MADAKSKEETTSGNAFMIDARAAKIQAKDWREREKRRRVRATQYFYVRSNFF
jgi:hypothetical protein